MPIGFELGTGGGGSVSAAGNAAGRAVRETAQRTYKAVEVWSLVEQSLEWTEWILAWREERYPVRWRGWETHADERTCSECSIYAGDSWEEDTWHPSPPLHVNCRCREVLSRIEWRVRYVPEWQLAFRRSSWFDWVVTGWEWKEQAGGMP